MGYVFRHTGVTAEAELEQCCITQAFVVSRAVLDNLRRSITICEYTDSASLCMDVEGMLTSALVF